MLNFCCQMDNPFASHGNNSFAESSYKTIPNAFGFNNLVATQTHDRFVNDKFATYVTPQPQPCPCNQASYEKQYIYATPRPIPGGVSFSFNPEPQPYPYCNGDPRPYSGYQQPEVPLHQAMTLQQQIALKELEKRTLELMLLQEQLRMNSYHLQFHQNQQTSTGDLGTPCDMCNPNTVMILQQLENDIQNIGQQKLHPDIPPGALDPVVAKGRPLILTKSPDLKDKEKMNDRKEKFNVKLMDIEEEGSKQSDEGTEKESNKGTGKQSEDKKESDDDTKKQADGENKESCRSRRKKSQKACKKFCKKEGKLCGCSPSSEEVISCLIDYIAEMADNEDDEEDESSSDADTNK